MPLPGNGRQSDLPRRQMTRPDLSNEDKMLSNLAKTVPLAVVAFCAGLVLLPQGATAAPRSGATVHLANGATFDWLAPKPAAKGARLTNGELLSSDNAVAPQKRFFGNGSYICSPAGFGMRARCFTR